MELGYNRLGNFSFRARRIMVGVALVPCLLSGMNVYLGWHLLGGFDNAVLGGCLILLFLVMRYLGPTMQEIREYREAARNKGSD